MKYLLDTNILSQLIKKHPDTQLITRLASKSPHSLLTSCICVMELRFGSALRKNFESFWLRIFEEILSKVHILPLGFEEMLIAGDTLAHLQQTGNQIGIEDILIASTALNHQCIMVTANTRHFSKIPGLIVENWLTI